MKKKYLIIGATKSRVIELIYAFKFLEPSRIIRQSKMRYETEYFVVSAVWEGMSFCGERTDGLFIDPKVSQQAINEQFRPMLREGGFMAPASIERK